VRPRPRRSRRRSHAANSICHVPRFRSTEVWRRLRDAKPLVRFDGRLGLRFVDLDEGANRVVVGYLKDQSESRIRAEIERMGVPSDALVVEKAGDIGPVYGPTLSDPANPPVAGTAVTWGTPSGPFTYNWIVECTLGPTLRLDGAVVLTTASHCTVNPPSETQGMGVVDPTSRLKPGTSQSPATIVGAETHDPPFIPQFGSPNARWSDWAAFSPSASSTIGLIARTYGPPGSFGNAGSVTIDPGNPYFNVTVGEGGGIANGWTLYKMGRQTGWMQGTVLRSCVDMKYGTSSLDLLCQFEMRGVGVGGDSGSPIFAPFGSTFMVVGIVSQRGLNPLWGFTMWFSGLRGFERDLFGAFNTGRLQVL
jgi:hypothetical protein